MKILDRIRRRKPEPTAPTEPEPGYWWWIGKGGMWGNHLSWNVDQKLFYGHGSRAPEVGDMLHSERTSGRIGVFRVIEVKWANDPRDMFTGKVTCLGYLDELPEHIAFGKGEGKTRTFGDVRDDLV